VITSAGFILAGTFAALVLAPLPNLRQIGFGVTVGILIDTFVVRTLLVPAATMLLGRWAFWPRIPAAGRPDDELEPPERVAGSAVIEADEGRLDTASATKALASTRR
jgi:RND superfamily putative drug exporter